MKCEHQRLVDAHFAGAITPDEERALREHLHGCDACRQRYARRQILAKLDPAAFPAEERLARGLGIRKQAPARVLPFAFAALSLAAILFFVLRSPGSDGFTARGNLLADASPTAAVSVYRLPKDGALLATAEGNPVQASDELAFSYRNDGHFTHLMIFGVDENQRVYWFYPAWTNEIENPKAIRIEGDRSPHELREAIRHRFSGEHLAIHSVFLDHELTVRDVESALGRQKIFETPMSVDGAKDHVTMLEVTR